ncbi:MAG: winged helix DNA-binding domain-containing protein [Fimbriimonas sp.]
MSAIGLRRLQNQGIASPKGASPAQVVAHLGALQGQDYAGVKWSIGLRSSSATDREIEQAFDQAKIVRTWPMRGTLHVVAAEDVRWILRLLEPRIRAKNKGRYGQLGLDESTLARATDVMGRALEGGMHLTRAELAAELERSGIDPAGQRMAYLLQQAGIERVLCFGVRRGKEFTFTLLDDWVPIKPAELSRDEALATLALRYFSSRGPATDRDFAYWSGLSLTEVRAGLESVASRLRKEALDGRTFWGPIYEPERDAARVHALPGFDEFYLGYQDRSAVIDGADEPKIVPGGNGVFNSMIVSDGRIVGTWRRTIKSRTVEIEASPFSPLDPRDRDGFREAADRFAAFLQLEAVYR